MTNINEKELLIHELEYVLDLLKNSSYIFNTGFSGGLEYDFDRYGWGVVKKGRFAHYKLNLMFSLPTPNKDYKEMSTKSEYKEALADMVKWFGKYPEMIPAPDCFDKYKAAIDNAKRLLENDEKEQNHVRKT